MNENDTNVARLDKWGPIGGAAFVIGLIVCLAGLGGGMAALMQSYHFAYIFWGFLTLGCLGIQILHHTIRASWGLSILRLTEAGGGPVAIAVMALLFIPIALNMPAIFPWADPQYKDLHAVMSDPFKAAWFNHTFFLLRAALYFILWFALAYFNRKWSLQQDQTMDPNLGFKRTNLSSPGIVFFIVSVTLATTDWVMSLEPHWFSTVLGLLTVVGQALAAVSLGTIIVLSNRNKEPYHSIINPKLTKDLGNMLFCLTMLWAYLTLSQFLITWSGNVSDEAPYYIARSQLSWNWLGTVIILFQFFVPFTALLAPRLKRYWHSLIKVAIMIFIVRFLDIYWTVMPALRMDHQTLTSPDLMASLTHFTDYGALLALGGVWFAVFGTQIKQGSLLPKHDTRLLEVAEHA